MSNKGFIKAESLYYNGQKLEMVWEDSSSLTLDNNSVFYKLYFTISDDKTYCEVSNAAQLPAEVACIVRRKLSDADGQTIKFFKNNDNQFPHLIIGTDDWRNWKTGNVKFSSEDYEEIYLKLDGEYFKLISTYDPPIEDKHAKKELDKVLNT